MNTHDAYRHLQRDPIALGELLRAIRKDKLMTLKMVSEKCPLEMGIGYISGVETGKNQPPFIRVMALAHTYGVSLDDMAATLMGNQVGWKRRRERAAVPIISWVAAGGLEEATVNLEDETTDWVQAPDNAGPRSFALIVKGDSMTSAYGPSFPDGSVIIVDPDHEPKNKSMVIVCSESSDAATFKQLVTDPEKTFLSPLNQRFPIVELTSDHRIAGTVIDAHLKNLLT